MQFLYIIIITPIEKFLNFCIGPLYGVTGNYGISLILLSLLVNIILVPLYHLADKWRTEEKDIQKRMSVEIESIKKYYKGEKRYFQIKAVYRRYGYNPLYALRVSLGFLIQIPFFFAAYHFLSNYNNLNGASFLFIKNLGAPDGFLFQLNILPLIMTLLNVASGVIYSRNMTGSEKVQLHGLSILFLILLYNMPSGLVLYWTMNNVFSLIKNTIRDIKIEGRTFFKARITKISLKKSIESFAESRYIKYIIFGGLFIVADLMTFYYLCEDKSDGLARMSIFSSVVLLFVIISVISLNIMQYRIKNFREFVLFYLAMLLTTSIGLISLGRLQYVLRITTEVIPFVFYCQLFVITILLCHYFSSQRDKYGYFIFGFPSSLTKEDTKNFIISLILFNIIYFIWGPSLTVHSAPNEFFIGYIYILLWQLYFFLLALAGFYSIYFLAPQLLKKYFSFILLFFSITAIIYLIFNRRDVGLMSNFNLHVPSNLNLKSHEMFLDILCIYSMLLLSYIILKYASESVYRYIFVAVIIILLTSAYYVGDIFRIQNIQNKIDATSVHRFELTLSKERNNVLVFMLDGFSGGAMKHIQDNIPDVLDGFNGFTWYKNVVTSNTGTWGAIATLYGGNRYSVTEINSRVQQKTIREYFVEAYNLYKREFFPKGYKVKIVNPEFLSCSEIDNNAECYKTKSYGSDDLLKSGVKLKGYQIPLLVEAVTIFKAAPHTFKNYFI